jgi:ubiquinone/menaquinone biosynthesis C-methylase UbiE
MRPRQNQEFPIVTAPNALAPEPGGIFDDVPGAPALSYFWRRKRNLSLRLLTRHCEFAAPAAAPRRMVLADVGCGWATDLCFFDQALRQFGETGRTGHDWHVVGIDGDPDRLQLARDRLARAGVRVELMHSNFESRIPMADHSADVIYCSEVLEHLLDPIPFLAEWRRVLRPGGRALVTTPNEPNLLQRSFYSRRRREANRLKLLKTPQVVTGPDGTICLQYDHIGIRRIDEWEVIFASQGLRLVDFERGALVYGSPFHNRAAVFAAQRAAEFALDALPKHLTRFVSDQLIGLYQAV